MKSKNLIAGILLCLPLALLLIPLMLILAPTGINTILLPILLYVPVSIGLLFTSTWYKNNKYLVLKIIAFMFIVLSIAFMAKAYIFESNNWNDLGFMLLGIITLVIGRILTNIYFALIAGWKIWFKYLIFMVSITLIVLFVYVVIFGAPAL